MEQANARPVQPMEVFFMKKITLTRGQFALVDDDDFVRFGRFKWYADWNKCTKSFYARRNAPAVTGRQRPLRLHRAIMNEPADMQVDHKNGNSLDCRRENLRSCTQLQNSRNRRVQKNSRTGILGIHFNKANGMYIAHIQGKYLGIFDDKEEAMSARASEAAYRFGEFSRL